MSSRLQPLMTWLFALGLISAVSANAQAPTEPDDKPDISAEAVENFADAYVAVQMINQEYGDRLLEVEDPDESTRLQRQAQNQMQQAVVDAGLSISDYQTIAEQANDNETLRNRIETAVDDRANAEE